MFIGETEYYSKNVFLLFVVLYSLESTLIIKNIIICSSFENQWKVMLATYIGELYAKVHSKVDDFLLLWEPTWSKNATHINNWHQIKSGLPPSVRGKGRMHHARIILRNRPTRGMCVCSVVFVHSVYPLMHVACLSLKICFLLLKISLIYIYIAMKNFID